jgi:hypothetical protein
MLDFNSVDYLIQSVVVMLFPHQFDVVLTNSSELKGESIMGSKDKKKESKGKKPAPKPVPASK